MHPIARSDRDRSEDLGGGIFLHVLSSRDDPQLSRFFDAYDAAFVLESEKEDLDGFRACLALNEGEAYARLSARYGPYRERLVLLTRGRAGAVLGAANFTAFAGTGLGLTVALSYIFVAEEARRQGHFARLVEAVRREACASFVWPEGPPVPLIFIELNDPLRMPAEDYARDSAHSGVDQVERLRIWARQGARLLELPYCQPPLSAGQTEAPALLLGVLGAEGERLDACLLRTHLRRFFATTVLKGTDPEQSPVAARQLAWLEAACRRGVSVALVGPEAFLAAPGRD